MKKCELCGETRIFQDDPTDNGYNFVVFCCYSQYHIELNGTQKLIHQGTLCKDFMLYKLKNSSPHNELSNSEAERLAWLLEELGEVQQAIGKVQQAIGKILRHGYDSKWPPDIGPSNRDNLEKEIRDVIKVLRLMDRFTDINLMKIENSVTDDYSRCYLHHQDLS
ncbi:MAG: hypothetical protein WC503_00675 [Candidatus Shapirobacteria bacterium]